MTDAFDLRWWPLAVQFDPQSQVIGGIGMADRGVVADSACFIEVKQRLIEGNNFFLGAGAGQNGFNFLDPALKNQLGYQRGVDQNFHRRNRPG